MPEHFRRYIRLCIFLLAMWSGFSFGQIDTLSDFASSGTGLYAHKLSNGMQVLVLEDSTLNLVQMSLCARAGASVQTPQTEGLLHLHDQMFFYGQSGDGKSFVASSQNRGDLLSSESNLDAASFRLTVTTENWESAANQWLQTLQSPQYEKTALEAAKQKIARTFQLAETSPLYFLEKQLRQKLWYPNGARINPLGDFEQIYASNPNDLIGFHDQFYFPENCLLAVTGDVKADSVFLLLDSVFSPWQGAGTRKFLTHQPVPLEKNEYFFTENAFVKVPVMQWDWQGPGAKIDASSFMAARLWCDMQNAPESIFQEALVKPGYAVSVHWSIEQGAGGSPLTLQIIPDPRKLDHCIEEVHRLIQAEPDSLWTIPELEAAKLNLQREWRFLQEKSTIFQDQLIRSWALQSLNLALQFPQKVAQVNQESMELFLNTYILNRHHVAGMLVSSNDRAGLGLDEIFTDPVPPTPPPPAGPPFVLDSFVIHFMPNSMEPDFPSRILLSGLAYKLKAYPQTTVFVDGHTDSQGDEEFNLELSLKRASSVRNYLVTFHKIDSTRLEPRGFGESQLLNPGFRETEMAENRRVTFEWKDL